LPPPVGKQKEVVTLAPEGHVVVLGTAGSGKTTMAIHRAAFVADERADHGGRTLLVTFNRALVTYLEHLFPPELRDVDVRTYHHFARGYLASCGLMSFNAICDNDLRHAA
jgi:DNA helicase IV